MAGTLTVYYYFPKIDYTLTKFTGIKQNLLRDAREYVQSAQLMPGARYHDKGSQINKSPPEKATFNRGGIL